VTPSSVALATALRRLASKEKPRRPESPLAPTLTQVVLPLGAVGVYDDLGGDEAVKLSLILLSSALAGSVTTGFCTGIRAGI